MTFKKLSSIIISFLLTSFVAICAVAKPQIPATSDKASANELTKDRYNIEIIVFDHLTENALRSELWPSHPALPNYNKAIDFNISHADNDNYQALPADQLQLNKIISKLERRKDYKVLLHTAWQAYLPPAKRLKIHLYADPQTVSNNSNIEATASNQSEASEAKDYIQAEPSFMTDPNDDIDANNINQQAMNQDEAEINPLATLYDPTREWLLNGTISISKSRYFNLHSDLLLTIPRAEITDLVDASQVSNLADRQVAPFLFQANRRLRSGEIHYIDHPLFGMLVLITPAKQITAKS